MPFQDNNPFTALIDNAGKSGQDVYLQGSASQPEHFKDPSLVSAIQYRNLDNYNDDEFINWLKNDPSAEAKDYYIQYRMYKNLLQDDRQYNAMREDTAYQRAVADMRKAGISPYALGSFGSTPINSGDGFKVSGNNYSARARNEENAMNDAMSNGIKAGLGIISALTALLMFL